MTWNLDIGDGEEWSVRKANARLRAQLFDLFDAEDKRRVKTFEKEFHL